MKQKKKKRLYRQSRVMQGPGAWDEEQPRVPRRRIVDMTTDRARGLSLLMEAQGYWLAMDTFRRDRERNKNYTYGKQWDDWICIEGTSMKEEDYIRSQGNVALKNNHIRKCVRSILGLYREQEKEPTCIARDRREQRYAEMLSTLLQYNMQLNRMVEMNARCMEEFLISGFVAQRKWHGWRRELLDCWTDNVQPNNMFVDNNMRDFRGWDVSVIGEVHDVSFEEVCSRFAKSPADNERLRHLFHIGKMEARGVRLSQSNMENFGYPQGGNYSFLVSPNPGRCRVIEIWRKEMKPRYRCHDVNTGEFFKIEIEDWEEFVGAPNRERLAMAKEFGIREEDVPLVRYKWAMDTFWMQYQLTPFGDILEERETPYEHKEHPYVFKAYPFIDGEIHSFVADIIDQQRYINRLITMNDWIMRASAKGVLLFPEDCLPKGMDMKDVADEWARFNGVIMIKASKTGQLPQQIANNCTHIGIHELLNIQLKFFEDISGVNGALQGKPGFSGMSASLYQQQTQNATTSLVDMLDTFSAFVKEGAIKDMKNIQQYYETSQLVEIIGPEAEDLKIAPMKIRNLECDISFIESTTTPTYRTLQNDMLMKLFELGAINIKMLLENGNFPFADRLLQSIETTEQEMAEQQQAQAQQIPPEILQAAQQGADMKAVKEAQAALGA